MTEIDHDKPAPATGPRAALGLTVGAIGVVFGDIGTSPLYAMRESLARVEGAPEAAVMGVLSLIFWALTRPAGRLTCPTCTACGHAHLGKTLADRDPQAASWNFCLRAVQVSHA